MWLSVPVEAKYDPATQDLQADSPVTRTRVFCTFKVIRVSTVLVKGVRILFYKYDALYRCVRFNSK